jgi:acetyl esterase/lipase
MIYIHGGGWKDGDKRGVGQRTVPESNDRWQTK